MRSTVCRCVLPVLVGWAVASAAVPARAGENYALLVGVADYDEKELRPLKFTRADVLEFHAALLDSGFPSRNVVLMHDDFEKLVAHYKKLGGDYKPKDFIPTGANVRKELELVLGRLRPDDSVIVAFAGHGVQFKSDKKSYFCPSDARLDSRDSLIAFEDVFAAMKDCPAGRKLFLVDACQNDPQSEISRSRATVDLDSVTRPQTVPVPEGIIALFSCKAGQKAFEHPPLGHGVFFYHLLEGWKGDGDLNGDGKLSYQELANYTEKKTSEYAALKLKVLQTPVLRNEFSGGEWILRELQKASLPPPLFDAKNGKTTVEAKASQEAWAKHLKTSVEIENSLGMKLRLIPPGEYLRGSTVADVDKLDPVSKKYAGSEQPQHAVRISKPFLLSATEVTRGQFRRFVNATGHVTDAETGKGGKGFSSPDVGITAYEKPYNWKNTGFAQADEHPVVNVSWNDARAFVDWLTREEGKEYRLPTEAEWEYACRAGATGLFSGGDSLDGTANVADQALKRLGGNLKTNEMFATFDDGYQFTAPVAKFRANAFGLFDMHGNAMEWCSDAYDSQEYARHAGRTAVDPPGARTGTYRVFRGGSWDSRPESSRSARRNNQSPDARSCDWSFRVAAAASVK